MALSDQETHLRCPVLVSEVDEEVSAREDDLGGVEAGPGDAGEERGHDLSGARRSEVVGGILRGRGGHGGGGHGDEEQLEGELHPVTDVSD